MDQLLGLVDYDDGLGLVDYDDVRSIFALQQLTISSRSSCNSCITETVV